MTSADGCFVCGSGSTHPVVLLRCPETAKADRLGRLAASGGQRPGGAGRHSGSGRADASTAAACCCHGAIRGLCCARAHQAALSRCGSAHGANAVLHAAMPGCHGLIAGGGGPTLGLGYGRPVSLLRLHGLRQRVPLQRPCSALHCIALHCIALHCIALHCIPNRSSRIQMALNPARARAHPHSARRQAAQHAQMRRTRRRRQPIAAALAVRGSPEATGLPASWNERYDAYCSCERRRWDSYLRCTTAELTREVRT